MKGWWSFPGRPISLGGAVRYLRGVLYFVPRSCQLSRTRRAGRQVRLETETQTDGGPNTLDKALRQDDVSCSQRFCQCMWTI